MRGGRRSATAARRAAAGLLAIGAATGAVTGPASAQPFTPETALFSIFTQICVRTLPDFEMLSIAAADLGMTQRAAGTYQRGGVAVSVGAISDGCSCAAVADFAYTDAVPRAAETGLQDLAERLGGSVEETATALREEAAEGSATRAPSSEPTSQPADQPASQRAWLVTLPPGAFLVGARSHRGAASFTASIAGDCSAEALR